MRQSQAAKAVSSTGPEDTPEYQWHAVPHDKFNGGRLSQRGHAQAWARRTSGLCLITNACYLYYRVALARGPGGHAEAASQTALWAEIFYFMVRFPYYLIFLGAKGDNVPSLELDGEDVPKVDVFITYCGEGLDIISDTMFAACSLSYPKSRFRVFILDDSCSDELKDLITSSKERFPNLYYSTRGDRPKTHSKAGNVNHGLRYADNMPGGPYELCAFLDADNIPEKCWLRRVLPHLLKHPKMAVACPSARAYNIPPKDPLNSALEPRMYYSVMLPVLGASEQPAIIGTGFVARRAAIDSIGGIPTESITEDGQLTVQLRAYGWDLVWVQEYLQWNLVTETLADQIKQRCRWTIGAVETAVYAVKTDDIHWSFGRRFKIAFVHLLLFLPTATAPLSMLALPLALLSKSSLIHVKSPAHLRFVLALSLIDVLAQISHGVAVSFLAGRPLSTFYYTDKHWLQPYFLIALIKHYMPAKNAVSSTQYQGANSSRVSSKKESQLPSKISIPPTGTLINVASLLALAPVVAYTLATSTGRERDIFEAAKHLVVRAGWPSLLLVSSTYIVNSGTLMLALLRSPPELDRQTCLTRDPDSQLAYPTLEAQKNYDRETNSSNWHSILIFGYSLAVGTVVMLA